MLNTCSRYSTTLHRLAQRAAGRSASPPSQRRGRSEMAQLRLGAIIPHLQFNHVQEHPVGYPVIDNPVTGERGIVRCTPNSDGAPLVADLYARPGAAVVGEHIHPHSTESFTVVRGILGLRLDGLESRAEAGTRVVIPPGTPHDWWNAGTGTAWVIVEVDPGRRFEALIRNMYGLARDGRTEHDRTPRPAPGSPARPRVRRHDSLHQPTTRPAASVVRRPRPTRAPARTTSKLPRLSRRHRRLRRPPRPGKPEVRAVRRA